MAYNRPRGRQRLRWMDNVKMNLDKTELRNCAESGGTSEAWKRAMKEILLLLLFIGDSARFNKRISCSITISDVLEIYFLLPTHSLIG